MSRRPYVKSPIRRLSSSLLRAAVVRERVKPCRTDDAGSFEGDNERSIMVASGAEAKAGPREERDAGRL